jgi:hypothetical protein
VTTPHQSQHQYQQITVQALTQPRYLLSAVVAPPRLDIIRIYDSPSALPQEDMDVFLRASIVALDFETQGNDFSHPDFRAVGVGLSTDTLSVYVDLSEASSQEKREFLMKLGPLPLIGHNVMFDGGVFYRETGLNGAGGYHANWRFCTYGLFKQLSSESNELRWGLKDAQKELLGWAETNEVELDEWLVSNGFVNQAKRPLKGEMWRAPRSILGKYCALDAQSTWQLFARVLEPALKPFPILRQFHGEDFLTEVEFLIEQQITGITVDKERLAAYEIKLRAKTEELQASFLCHLDVADHIATYNARELQSVLAAQPDKFLKPPKLGAEPSRFTRSGKPSVNWDKWDTKRVLIENWDSDPDNISANWRKWKEKADVALTAQHFNINSGKQLRWLFYETMGLPVRVLTKPNKKNPDAPRQPAINEDALKLMGPATKDLIGHITTKKELGYVQKCMEKLRCGRDGLWRVHPQYRVPGTLTGRLSGTGGLNVQQLPKSGDYLACWKPLKPDNTWVDFDIVGAEAVVATELTRDPAMMAVYGPGVVKNDIYLFFGSQIPGIGDQFKAAGYTPHNPSKEGLDRAKETCKNLRNICKTVVLAKQYGAGASKIHQTLQLQEVDVSFDEVKAISDGYDRTFAVLKGFGRKLEEEWKKNKGWVLNGIGRPVTVSEKYLKDLTNRVVQSTGHDIHMKAIKHFRDVMKKHRIKFEWVVPDFHDQGIVECSISDAEKIKNLISTEVVDRLNKELGGLIPIKYDPQVVSCMAAAKVEGFAKREKEEKLKFKTEEDIEFEESEEESH